ncbi:unnamed protein product [Porites evermanni]|uniref:TTF-type domain-containing protein n=1 Tax=Porites evermanni TaxID=104178 RepID=A0ABN8QJN4_9CNID|nr:unnamed protein product [Porites evermanni]
MSKQRKISAVFGREQPENNAENAETDEAEPGKDQGSELKAKVAKRNFQDSWLEKYKWLKYDPPKDHSLTFCSCCQQSGKSNPFTTGCINYGTSTLVRHIESQDHRNALQEIEMTESFQEAVMNSVSSQEQAVEGGMRTKIQNVIAACSIPVDKVMCFGSDGASIMTGRVGGVSTLLKKGNPFMINIVVWLTV